MADVRFPLTQGSAFGAGLTVFVVATAVIVAALGFEHWGGYTPCPLCLQQRYAYYAAIPACLLGLLLLPVGWTRLAAALFVLVAVGFLVNAGLGVYQAGAEWKFWPGPQSCAGVQEITPNVSDLLKRLPETPVVRCDEAAWRFAGLSFSGWNVAISALLAAASLRAGVRAFARE